MNPSKVVSLSISALNVDKISWMNGKETSGSPRDLRARTCSKLHISRSSLSQVHYTSVAFLYWIHSYCQNRKIVWPELYVVDKTARFPSYWPIDLSSVQIEGLPLNQRYLPLDSYWLNCSWCISAPGNNRVVHIFQPHMLPYSLEWIRMCCDH